MDKKLYLSSIIFSVVGLLVSIYMSIYKFSNNNAMCLGSGDCATVNASRFSEIYGIPVAFFGVFGFVAIILVHFLEKRIKLFEQQGTLMIFGMGLFGFIFVLYLTYVELYVIHAICPFCVATAIAMVLVFIIAIIRLVRNQPE